MNNLANFGDVLCTNARLTPTVTGVADLDRSLSFAELYERSCRLANALSHLGLEKGDRFCVLAFNRMEWVELYAAAALGGFVAVPINFRLSAPEIRYIVQDCGARVLIVEAKLANSVEAIRDELAISEAAFVLMGETQSVTGYQDYEGLIQTASASRPVVLVDLDDPWALMYTSGTTGHPKGAIRSHRASAMLAMTTAVEMSITREDRAMLVMPMCHANSFFFMSAFAYCGAPLMIYSRPSFDPENMMAAMDEYGTTFTSLVPTQYIMILDQPAAVRKRYACRSVTRLMISSAPARKKTKRAIMEQFSSAGLFELYGSSETGYVTMLHPQEQFTKLGSVGRECVGTLPIKLLDGDGNEVAPGETGELYSCNGYTFDGYWGQPDKTREAFRGNYCSVGDMARRDADGYLYLVDRRSNMIISGGENIYPSEVEAVLAANPKVRDVVVIGLADPKWGERVHAVVVASDGTAPSEGELIDWCRPQIAGYKWPRSITFITEDALPRTATGKIQHAVLRQRLAKASPPAAA